MQAEITTGRARKGKEGAKTTKGKGQKKRILEDYLL